jgi:hypothetical protein
MCVKLQEISESESRDPIIYAIRFTHSRSSQFTAKNFELLLLGPRKNGWGPSTSWALESSRMKTIIMVLTVLEI